MQDNEPKVRIGYLFKLISDRLKATADSDLQGHDLTFTQSRVLKFIKENGGEATQKEIEDSLGVAHPTVVGIISRLKEKGFVECRVSSKDRRNRIVSMTQRSVDIMNQMSGFIDRNEARMLEGISRERVFELERTLLQVLGNLDAREVVDDER